MLVRHQEGQTARRHNAGQQKAEERSVRGLLQSLPYWKVDDDFGSELALIRRLAERSKTRADMPAPGRCELAPSIPLRPSQPRIVVWLPASLRHDALSMELSKLPVEVRIQLVLAYKQFDHGSEAQRLQAASGKADLAIFWSSPDGRKQRTPIAVPEAHH